MDELDEAVEVFGCDLYTIRVVVMSVDVLLTASFSWSK